MPSDNYEGMTAGTTMEEIPLSSGDDDFDNPEALEKAKQEKSFWTRVWQGLALASFGLSVAAIIIHLSIVVIIMGVIAIVVAAVVFRLQNKLQDTDSMRRVQNLLRKEVNRLQIENNKLESEVTRLGKTVDGLKESETKLSSIAKEQGSNIESLVALVKENGEIADELDKATRADLMQSLFRIVLTSDRDNSFTIGPTEVSRFILKFTVDPRVTVNEELLRSTMAKNDGHVSMSHLVHDLLDNTADADQQIFHVDALAAENFHHK